jgi:hypothetical protein
MRKVGRLVVGLRADHEEAFPYHAFASELWQTKSRARASLEKPATV